MTEEHGDDSTEDRPGPYRGVFGSAEGPPSSGTTPYGDRPSAYGDAPAAYGGVYGADAHRYQANPPKQVTIAAVISLALGAMCLLLAAVALTSAGAQVSEVLTGSKENQGVAVAAALICAFVYLLPAIYLRKRRPWSRYLLIGVAAIGIAGGVMTLPASIVGLAIHSTLLILMLQQPTKLWFHHR
jgi:MFS family permease